ncbi:ATP-dependent RNA helicase DDX60 [Pelomyxa schiedti]|nr:ATP-dependent RNA helicase DDX60 [Pelomyxa schiedti]
MANDPNDIRDSWESLVNDDIPQITGTPAHPTTTPPPTAATTTPSSTASVSCSPNRNTAAQPQPPRPLTFRTRDEWLVECGMCNRRRERSLQVAKGLGDLQRKTLLAYERARLAKSIDAQCQMLGKLKAKFSADKSHNDRRCVEGRGWLEDEAEEKIVALEKELIAEALKGEAEVKRNQEELEALLSAGSFDRQDFTNFEKAFKTLVKDPLIAKYCQAAVNPPERSGLHELSLPEPIANLMPSGWSQSCIQPSLTSNLEILACSTEQLSNEMAVPIRNMILRIAAEQHESPFNALFDEVFHWHSGKPIDPKANVISNEQSNSDGRWVQKSADSLTPHTLAKRDPLSDFSQTLHIAVRVVRQGCPFTFNSGQSHDHRTKCLKALRNKNTVTALQDAANELIAELHQQVNQYRESAVPCSCFITARDILINFSDVIGPVNSANILNLFSKLGFPEPSFRLQHPESLSTPLPKRLDDSARILHQSVNKLPLPSSRLSMARFQMQMSHEIAPLMDTQPGYGNFKNNEDVKFIPDEWQRQLMDYIVTDTSCLVTTPTSSGKSFVSFFVISRFLEKWGKGKGLVALVVPTLALANQTRAYAVSRYGGKVSIGEFTSSFRFNENTCDVLICTPAILEILLLSPHPNVSSRLTWAVFDEIHTIMSDKRGDVEGDQGAYSRLLALCPCPFLALSAAITNPIEVAGWLSKVTNRPVNTIPNSTMSLHRWAPFHYYTFNGSSLEIFHPYSVASEHTTVECLEAVELTPRQLFDLYTAMEKHLDESSLQPLRPETFFGNNFLTRDLCLAYKKALDREFCALSNEVRPQVATTLGAICRGTTETASTSASAKPDRSLEVVKLIQCLSERQSTPAILFGGGATKVIDIVTKIVQHLEQMHSPMPNKVAAQKSSTTDSYVSKAPKSERNSLNRESTADTRASRKHLQREINQLRLKQAKDEMRKYAEETVGNNNFQCCRLSPKKWLLDGEGGALADFYLERLVIHKGMLKASQVFVWGLLWGVAAYGRNIPKPYRDLTECMFRAGVLPVIISTDALAIGINVPCKTVAFLGGSPNAIETSQMMGRAGRRGYDSFGDIVFYDWSYRNLRHSLLSPLPAITSKPTMDVNTALRCLIYYFNHENKAEAKRLLSSLLAEPISGTMSTNCPPCSNPVSTSTSPPLSRDMQAVFRFSVEMLYELHLVDNSGTPIGPAGLVSHLFDRSPGNFVIAHLILSGALDEIAGPFTPEFKIPAASLQNPVPYVLEAKNRACCTLVNIVSYIMGRKRAKPHSFGVETLPLRVMDSIRQYNALVASVHRRVLGFFTAQVISPAVFPDIAITELPPTELSGYASNTR